MMETIHVKMQSFLTSIEQKNFTLISKNLLFYGLASIFWIISLYSARKDFKLNIKKNKRKTVKR